MKGTPTGVDALGAQGPSYQLVYNNLYRMFPFPFNYSDVHQDNYTGTILSSGYTWSRTGSCTAVYDGYGTLITPAGTYNNVIRVKWDMINDDTTTGFVAHFETTSYSYYHPSSMLALVQVVYTTSWGTTTKQVEYVDILLSAEDEEESNSFQLYPNPAKDQTIIQCQGISGDGSVEIYDLQGKLLITGKISSGETRKVVNTSNLIPGMYLVKVINGEQSSVEKLVIE